MNNAQIADLITSECKKQNIKIALLLQECNINHSFISDIRHKNRAPSVDKISAIADYLGVSVDYLLGRTDEPKAVSNTGSIISQKYIDGDATASITHGSKEAVLTDKTTDEFMQLFQSLDIADKIAVMSLALEKSKK